ncbi:hypothetical protein LINPERHAP1_LOCUS33170 [Linum perenne]
MYVNHITNLDIGFHILKFTPRSDLIVRKWNGRLQKETIIYRFMTRLQIYLLMLEA